jgi:RNA polymerase sigma-70 factor (TIGR02943 family)
MSNQFAIHVEALQPHLLRFARAQLRNDAWAEDAVSETLVAALEKPHVFSGRSQLKTWLVGILKHKIIDQFRHYDRETQGSASPEALDCDECSCVPETSLVGGADRWSMPEEALRQRQFIGMLEACVAKLPPMQARCFVLRECVGLSADEVCEELEISSSNLWVLLHRARLRLRAGVQADWLDVCPVLNDEPAASTS